MIDARTWVPMSCMLHLIFDPAAGEWSAAVRLKHDYLGYLVAERAEDAETAIAKAHQAFRAGLENPGNLDIARAGYFRQVAACLTSPPPQE